MMRVVKRNDPAAVDRILRALPEWFGIEEAITAYADDAARLPSYLAVEDDVVVGVVLVKEHYSEAREVFLMAVDPSWHRQAVGRRLLEAVEADLCREGVEILEVHTVGPSYSDSHYAGTREFYRAVGFVAVHEFDRIDWDGPTLVLVKPLA